MILAVKNILLHTPRGIHSRQPCVEGDFDKPVNVKRFRKCSWVHLQVSVAEPLSSLYQSACTSLVYILVHLLYPLRDELSPVGSASKVILTSLLNTRLTFTTPIVSNRSIVRLAAFMYTVF